MLLRLQKSFEKCQIILTWILEGLAVLFSEKTSFLSLAERRRKSSSVVVEIVVCLIATNFNHSANPIAREFHPVWQMRKITPFIHTFSNFTKYCEQADFKPLSTLLLFNNPKWKKERKQDKFKTCFANAVEISIISTNLIKITLSQITIQKEWRLVSFCENC